MNAIRILYALTIVLLPLLPAGVAAAVPGSGAPALPEQLHDTGLFAPGQPDRLGAGVESFEPQHPLWSDGASKRRWIRLPPGTAIDARDPDRWRFPRGTKLWKEFSHGRACRNPLPRTRRRRPLALRDLCLERRRTQRAPGACRRPDVIGRGCAGRPL